MRFLGVLVKMTLHNLPNRERYWRVSDWDGIEYDIPKFMSKNTFKRTMRCLTLPREAGGEDVVWGNCKSFFRPCAA